VTDSHELLATAMDEAFREFVERLDGLTDVEFFWEPVPGCWNVYRDADGNWTYPYEEPDPVPSPVTTIGWRLVHVALCKVIYHEWAFGPRHLTFLNVETPHNVETCVGMLTRGHALLAADLAALDRSDLDRRVMTNWGEEWPAWRIFTTMTDHDARHGAEIGVLRDLYRASGGTEVPITGG
jgi:DinB family protein